MTDLKATDPTDLLSKVNAEVAKLNTQSNINTFGTISLTNPIVQVTSNNTQVVTGTTTGDTKTGLKVVADIHFVPSQTFIASGASTGDLFTSEVIYGNQNVTKSANEAELDKVTAVASANFKQNTYQTYVDSEFGTVGN